MTLYHINTGTGPNNGDGDSLRTAFNKVNANFNNVNNRLNNNVHIVQSDQPPEGSTSTIWYDTIGGRSYIYYDGTWIDQNPTVDYRLPAATTSTLGGVIPDGDSILIDVNGVISLSHTVTGSQGVQGAQGYQGFQGDQGVQGYQGFQGVQGYQGDQGVQGYQGFQGDQGYQGVQGDQGVQGYQGVQGAQGFQGVQGPTGTANLPVDTPGFLYDDGVGNFSWTQPVLSSLSTGTYTFALSTSGIVTLNGSVFLPGSGFSTTSTLYNAVSTSTLKIVSPPTTVYGSVLDAPGNIAFDSKFIYYCTGSFAFLTSSHPIQAGVNTNHVYFKQSDFATQPQPGWVFQKSTGGPLYTVTAVYTGVFFSPPPSTAYYQLNISSSTLNYSTSTIFLIGQTASNPIWVKTPWDALNREALNTNNSGYDNAQYVEVLEQNIKVRYGGNGDIELAAAKTEGLAVSYSGYYHNSLTINPLSSATTLSTNTWLAVNAAMSNVGDSLEIKLQDGSHIYRVTSMVTPTINNGTVVIETLV